jgi:hypothetical protein
MSHPFRTAVETGLYNDSFYLTKEMYGAGWFSKTFNKVKKGAKKFVKSATKVYNKIDKVGKKLYQPVTKPMMQHVFRPMIEKTLKPALDKINPIDYIPGGQFAKDMVRKTYDVSLAPSVKKVSNEVLGDDLTRKIERLGKKALDGASATTLLHDTLGKNVSGELGLSDEVKGHGLKRRPMLRASRGVHAPRGGKRVIRRH